MILNYNTQNGQTTRYVWGVGLAYQINPDGSIAYYHFNNFGHTAALTDEAGSITDRFAYTPYGEEIVREGSTPTLFRYTGFFGNPTLENGLIHMRARFYNPTLRRFLNLDPAREGWNHYAYAANNPHRFTDPSGLGIDSVFDALNDGNEFLGLNAVRNFTTQTIGAVLDFTDQYFIMRNENVIGNDHYHHAMANSRATQRGEWGEKTARLLSATRETIDYITGDTIGNSIEDIIANTHGQNIALNADPAIHNSIFDVRRDGGRAIAPESSYNERVFRDDILDFIRRRHP